MRPIAGQTSGRMVVSVTAGGPAEHAGLRLGDVLLAIDGAERQRAAWVCATSSAPSASAAAIEIRLMREGAVRSITLVDCAAADGLTAGFRSVDFSPHRHLLRPRRLRPDAGAP